MNHFDYLSQSEIKCEICHMPAHDIHHIIPRSKFGKKEKVNQDKINNLIALCRPCHENAHREWFTKSYLQTNHNAKLNSGI